MLLSTQVPNAALEINKILACQSSCNFMEHFSNIYGTSFRDQEAAFYVAGGHH